jgi:hypothetical protein
MFLLETCGMQTYSIKWEPYHCGLWKPSRFKVIASITCAFSGELTSSWSLGKEGGVLTTSLLQD